MGCLGKSFALVLVLIFVVASSIIFAKPALSSPPALTENSWVSKASMHEARAYLGVAVANGKIYAIGGDKGVMVELLPATDLSFGFVSTTEEYDPEADNWTVKTPMPTARVLFGTAVYQNKIYCVGGYISGKTTGVNEVYNPATNTWETKTPMPTPMYGVQANTVNSKIYFMGISSNVIYAYDPQTDSWASKIPAPYVIASRVSAVFDNKIYFIGDLTNSSGVRIGTCIQAYDTITDNWNTITTTSLTASLGTSAGATSGVNTPAQIYFFDETVTNIYNLANNSWTVGTTSPSFRLCAGVAVVNDTFYVIGGRSAGQWGDPRLLHSAMFPSVLTEEYTPVGYGVISPVLVVSPVNETYNESSVPLTFNVGIQTSLFSYSLDGKDNVTIDGNATLVSLSNGLHNVTVYAKYSEGAIGVSQTVTFTVAKQPEANPTVPIAATSGALVVIAAGLLVHFKKRKQKQIKSRKFDYENYQKSIYPLTTKSDLWFKE
jgi:N-acetylneuraminic acid mutarotase